MAKVNMFAKAKRETKKPAKKAKNTKPQIDIEGLQELAAINSVLTALSAVKTTLEEQVKDAALDYFVKEGMSSGKKPANVQGHEKGATASLQLKKRSTMSALSYEEVELFDKYNISYDTVENQTTTFIINPAYKDDENLLEKVSNALSKVKGIPEDFIQMQVGVTKRVTTADSIDEVFKNCPDADVVEEALTAAGVLSVKPNYAGDVRAALDEVRNLVE